VPVLLSRNADTLGAEPECAQLYHAGMTEQVLNH